MAATHCRATDKKGKAGQEHRRLRGQKVDLWLSLLALVQCMIVINCKNHPKCIFLLDFFLGGGVVKFKGPSGKTSEV